MPRDGRAAAEQRVAQATGADGVPRTRAERGHARTIACSSGPVTVRRMACRAAGAADLHPAGASLDRPARRYSWQVQRAAVMYALAGSYEQAQIVVEAARDAPGFYRARQEPAGSLPGMALAISADGEGVAMRPEARRAGTARRARNRTRAFPGGKRLGPGEKTRHKRIAETGVVFAVQPPPGPPRTPEQVMTRSPGEPARGPRAVSPRYTAEITASRPRDDQQAVR